MKDKNLILITASFLKSMARMFFLIHNEAVGSAFTSPRMFRAGG